MPRQETHLRQTYIRTHANPTVVSTDTLPRVFVTIYPSRDVQIIDAGWLVLLEKLQHSVRVLERGWIVGDGQPRDVELYNYTHFLR